MPEPDPLLPSQGPDATRSRLSAPARPAYEGVDPPTVRTGGTGSGAGSSVRRSAAPPGAAPLPLPTAGERLDSFELEEAIGVGGMGAVFRALDLRLDRHVALKVLPPEQASDSEVVQRFYQEGRAAARLDHENIARVFTIGHDGKYHFIAFEYIEGTTARQRVERNGPLAVSEAINYTLQIADALVHAAERGVVHRDIKPSNIIVTPHGRAKLVDMGLARRFERGGDDGLTQSGMTLGTFDYISPEQARDPRDVDVRSDLYSLGCTLFHMLTGRPPFPEGTVLQKLIQHQEEPPPDIRALNPSVPPDLAGILTKLMAKDRDRRYQTPEQLVRDLLTLAGALGLRSVSPEGLVWLSAQAPSAWERHLVWGLPTLVFAAIVCGLVWWGQDAGTYSPPPPRAEVLPDTEKVTGPGPSPADRRRDRDARGLAGAGPALPRSGREREPGPAAPVAAEPAAVAGTGAASREIFVESTEDLTAVLAAAPPRAVIVLTDDGPYRVGPGDDGRGPADRLARRDLTVKADAGVRPVIRPDRGLGGGVDAGASRAALLDFFGGRVKLEGLEFLLDSAGPPAAVRAEDTELTVSRCAFRRNGPAAEPVEGAGRPAALLVQAVATGGDRAPAVWVERCHFDGGQAGVLATGPVDLSLVDCTLVTGPEAPAVWLDNARTSDFEEVGGEPVPAVLRLRHVSVLAGGGPVFRFVGTEPRVRIDDTAVAAGTGTAGGEGEPGTALVATDRPDLLSWRGRGNLYSKIATYLLPTGSAARTAAVIDPSRWEAADGEARELDPQFNRRPVWHEPDTLQAVAQDPAKAFRLAADHGGGPAVGARQGPFGRISPAARLAANAAPPPREPRTVDQATADTTGPATPTSTPPVRERDRERERGRDQAARSEAPATTTPDPTPEAGTAEESTASNSNGPSRMGDLPEMPVMPPTTSPGREKPDGTDSEPVEPAPTAPAPSTARTGMVAGANATSPAATAVPAPTAGGGERVEASVLRSAEQLARALGESAAKGGLLRVTADADWRFPGVAVRSGGSWRLQAEPGPTRPRLRFAPDQNDPRLSSPWSALFELRAGSLQLQGFDIVLPRSEAPRQGRWAAFAVWPATELSLTDCTVTVEGSEPTSAVVAVGAADNELEPGIHPPDGSAATVRLTDCLLRTGGDLVDVADGRRLALELNNAVVATGGSLVHAHGLPRGQTAEEVGLSLRQVTARMAGGLVQLESAVGEPELPVARVKALDSVLATTTDGDPLLRVDGQDAPAAVRNLVSWEGHGVGYHQISTYRRDRSAQVGTLPTNYARQDWTVALGAHETAPVHGDLKFLHKWDADRPAWTLRRDDAALAPNSPALSSSPDMGRIPDAPPLSF
jgi:serine/threonine-protein kinase